MKKKFRVAKAGQTTDGRAIPVEHINQMAANYNPATYNARVNLEHFKSMLPNSDFRCYGDVTGLETEVENGETYLVAEIDPTDDLVALAQSRQKVHFSIEYDPNFAEKGFAYLVGLACTDSPASLGTSYMQFCQQHPSENPLSARKSKTTNVVSTAEFTGDFDKPRQSVFSTITGLFSDKKTPEEQEAESVAQLLSHLPTTLSNIEAGLKALAQSHDALHANFGEVTKKIDAVETHQNEQQQALAQVQGTLDTTVDLNYNQRPPATGASTDYQKTDC